MCRLMAGAGFELHKARLLARRLTPIWLEAMLASTRNWASRCAGDVLGSDQMRLQGIVSRQGLGRPPQPKPARQPTRR